MIPSCVFRSFSPRSKYTFLLLCLPDKEWSSENSLCEIGAHWDNYIRGPSRTSILSGSGGANLTHSLPARNWQDIKVISEISATLILTDAIIKELSALFCHAFALRTVYVATSFPRCMRRVFRILPWAFQDFDQNLSNEVWVFATESKTDFSYNYSFCPRKKSNSITVTARKFS